MKLFNSYSSDSYRRRRSFNRKRKLDPLEKGTCKRTRFLCIFIDLKTSALSTKLLFAFFLKMSEASQTLTSQEIKAFYDTIDLLKSAHVMSLDKIEQKSLLLTVLNCKLQPTKAAEKYKKLLGCLIDFGINSFQELWTDDIQSDGSSLSTTTTSKVRHDFSSFQGCGRDKENRSKSFYIFFMH